MVAAVGAIESCALGAREYTNTCWAPPVTPLTVEVVMKVPRQVRVGAAAISAPAPLPPAPVTTPEVVALAAVDCMTREARHWGDTLLEVVGKRVRNCRTPCELSIRVAPVALKPTLPPAGLPPPPPPALPKPFNTRFPSMLGKTIAEAAITGCWRCIPLKLMKN